MLTAERGVQEGRRVGTLGASFISALDSAKAGQQINFGFANKEFTATYFPSDEANCTKGILMDLLVDLLKFLEKLNVSGRRAAV